MNLMEKIRDLLLVSFPGSQVEVSDMTGTMDHLEIVISAHEFTGLALLKQHRLVMDALKKEFSDKLHAVKIKTIPLKSTGE
jgi:stress-induced morphogen